MNDLIARLESADGRSRELDGDIAEALGIAAKAIRGWFGMERNVNRKGYAPVDRGRWSRSIPTVDSWTCPAYTESIDAALKLVPAGWSWLTHDGDGTVGAAFASLHRPGESDFLYAKDAANPAIAICIVCLKARAQTTD